MKLIIKKADFQENSLDLSHERLVISSYSTSNYGKNNGYINSAGKWSVESGLYSCLIDVTDFAGGEATINVTEFCRTFDSLTASNISEFAVVAFLSGDPTIVNGQSEPALIGSRVQISAGTSQEIDIPNDAVYLYVYVGYFPAGNSFSTTFLPKQIVLMK